MIHLSKKMAAMVLAGAAPCIRPVQAASHPTKQIDIVPAAGGGTICCLCLAYAKTIYRQHRVINTQAGGAYRPRNHAAACPNGYKSRLN